MTQDNPYRRHFAAVLIVGAALWSLACGTSTTRSEWVSGTTSAPPLLPPERWVAHLETEVLPFWSTPAALGDPPGAFPTFRCNDGSAYNPASPCPEMADLPEWLASQLGTEYTRRRSRQAFL